MEQSHDHGKAHLISKELNTYLEEMEKEQDEQRRISIRSRADGAINMALTCQLLKADEATEWQNKFIAAIFRQTKRGAKNNEQERIRCGQYR